MYKIKEKTYKLKSIYIVEFKIPTFHSYVKIK